MAKENKAYEEAAKTMFRLSSDEYVQEQCRRREEYYQQIRTYEKNLADKDATIAEQNATIAEQSATIADMEAKIAELMAQLGKAQNILYFNILGNIVENTTSAESQIRDTDMATEMVKYSNANILAQAGQSMLAQANQPNRDVLSILG